MPPDPEAIRLAAAEHRDRGSVAAAVGVTPRQLRRLIERQPEIRAAVCLGDADRLAGDYELCREIMESWAARG